MSAANSSQLSLEQTLQDLRDAVEELQADIKSHEEAIQRGQSTDPETATASKAGPWPKSLEDTISDLRDMRETMAGFQVDIENCEAALNLTKAKGKSLATG